MKKCAKALIAPVALVSLSFVAVTPPIAADSNASSNDDGDSRSRERVGIWSHGRPLAQGIYKERRNTVKVERYFAKRQVLVAYKLKRRTDWERAARCWNHKKRFTVDRCKWKRYKGHRIHENKKVFWRVCAGLYAKKRKHQVVKWGRWCSEREMSRR